MSKKKTRKTTNNPKSYSPKAMALAERAADKVLDPHNLHDELHEDAADEWIQLSKVIRPTLKVADTDERLEAADNEAFFLIGLAIGKRLAVQR